MDFRIATLHVRSDQARHSQHHPILGDELRALGRLQREQQPKAPFVFTSERGSPFTTVGFARMIEHAGKVAKLSFKTHPHMLRHACGYALANRGHDKDGVTRCQNDRTQGPACAIAAGAATIYRNYFAPVGGGYGQTAKRQFDGLADLGECSFADGFRVGDVDWDTQGGHYRVRLYGEWIVVPNNAVVSEPNKFGPAVVWPYMGTDGQTQIRCFLPGTGA